MHYIPRTLSILILTIIALCPLYPSSHAQTETPHRLAIRQIDGVAEFYDTVTGEKFIPRGANYIFWKRGNEGFFHDWVFQTQQFNPDAVREAFRDLAAHGYNTARIFLDICGEGAGCIAHNGQINPDYLANIATVMQIAAEEGIYLILTSNDLPDGGRYWSIVDQAVSPQMGGYRNANYLTEAGVEATRTYWRDILGGLVEHDPPFEVMLGWSLLNEQFFLTDQPPFTLESGTVTTSTGTYDMGDADQRRQMTTDALNYYIDEVSAVIREFDPDALITMGFFEPNFPNVIRDPSDNRLVDTAPLLETASLDFFDFHGYPSSQETLDTLAENYGMIGYEAKPIILGEAGGFNFVYETPAAAAYGVQQWFAESCEYGFDGWLYWEYYGDPGGLGDGVWGMVDEEGLILDALAPINQPDPCVLAEFASPNAALGKSATASRTLPDEPTSNATDGSAAQWGSGSDAPQWIEIDLGEPTAIGSVRLRVGQYPEGETRHQVWARLSSGQTILLTEFHESTRDDQWLELELPGSLPEVVAMRIETLESPSWVSWKEVEVYRADPVAAAACIVTANANINMRAEASTSAAAVGRLNSGRGAISDRSESGEDGFVWYHLLSGAWVREDVVTVAGGC